MDAKFVKAVLKKLRQVEALKARGLMSEIINWKLRLFVPVGDRGQVIFESLLDRWALTQIAERG